MTNLPFFQSAASRETPNAPVEVSPQALRVLVVEDHEDTRFMLRTMLERRGVKVLEAEDGEAAIHLAADACPHLILMDGGLPLLDGLEAARLIRARNDGLNRVPIVFLSGHAESDFQREAREAGCDDFLIKPINLDKLDSVLERHLRGSVIK